MKTYQLKILKDFLQRYYINAREVKWIGSGWFSDAYKFTFNNSTYVFRINSFKTDFEKDQLAAVRFNSPKIPVPVVRGIGNFSEDLFYCITDFQQGYTLHQIRKRYGVKGELKLVPQLLHSLEKIHGLCTDEYPGWGLTNAQGTGRFASWTDFLTAPSEEKTTLNATADLSCMTPYENLLGQLRAHMFSFLAFLPERKCVLHGDFRNGNLLIQSGKIAAVLDWAEMSLGDPLYDIVTMETPWEEEHVPYTSLWKKASERVGRLEPFFEERVTCYRIHRAIFEIEAHALFNKPDIAKKIAAWAEKKLRSPQRSVVSY
ncbi:MAG TPA: phosphotransferase [Chitinophaga sp.]|uniref:phosphotransferase family protein n=1 Tax=Chitinophaga sp. TaxID=1869181 RepID=UPI002C15A277|nr:phosphotransferase [Chitinophaga sp.]HVI46150.1 phosphotransferase [Chitinophaga sp.]